jgi:hypothetical protein
LLLQAFYPTPETYGRERLCPKNIKDHPFGLYLCVDDVDALAAAVCDLFIKAGAPYAKRGGAYAFTASAASGALVRLGGIAG